MSYNVSYEEKIDTAEQLEKVSNSPNQLRLSSETSITDS